MSSNYEKYRKSQITDVKISQSKQVVKEIIKIQHSKTEEPSKSVVYSDLEDLKHLKKLLEFLPLLRCPNCKERLGIVKKNELLETTQIHKLSILELSINVSGNDTSPPFSALENLQQKKHNNFPWNLQF